MLRILCLLTATLPLSLPAAAASSPWLHSDGGAVRIVTSGLADEDGRLQGVLDIRLREGWKTYWRDPGEVGVPPQIDVSRAPDVERAEILFPPPRLIENVHATWAGYAESVALPVVFTLSTPGTAGIIEGDVFLGICETVCIPIELSFSFDAGADPDNPQDAMLVEAAFGSLPAEPRPGFRLDAVTHEEQRLLLQAELPEDAEEPALFFVVPEGIRLSLPELVAREGTSATFSATLDGAPAAPGETVVLSYTLVAGRHAVSGTINLP